MKPPLRHLLLNRPLIVGLLVFTALMWVGAVFAQTPRQITLTLSWTNPTTSVDGVPLTGANALTGIDVFSSNAPIPDTATAQTIRLGAVQTTPLQLTATPGQTLYFRVRSVRGTEVSALSTQATFVVPQSTVPNAPTQLQITVTVP